MMASKRAAKRLSEARIAQLAHVKKRFRQRFALEMNRDCIREIERKIASGQAMLIETKPQIRNYFVVVSEKLIAVGYSKRTKRVVTALPEEYANMLPPGLLHIARLRLLVDESGVISDILSGTNCMLLHRQNESVSYYRLHYPGYILQIAYDHKENRL